jgi:acyl-CoA thioester hydrolase
MGGWHDSNLRVRFEETDMMGVVYYAKFLVWFEVGRINLMRDLSITVRDWEARGFRIPVVQAHADYKASARFDDEILVKTKIAEVGRTSVRFENEVYKLPGMELLCTGHTVHVLIDNEGRPVEVPDDIRSNLTSS